MKKGNIKNWVFGALLLLTVTLGLASVSSAIPVPAITLKEPGVASMTGHLEGSSQGFRFQTNSSLMVTSIGIIDGNGDGFINTHDVGLWNDSGLLLAGLSFSPTDPGVLKGDFRFKSISPVYLTGGEFFRLAASQIFHDQDLFDCDIIPLDTHIYDTDITFLSGANAVGAGLLFPDITGFSNLGFPPVPADVVGGNFEFEVVPEPSTALLLASGLLIIGVFRRKYKVRVV